jgi:hypothetical protein
MREDVEKTFDYDVLDPQTRAFVLQKTMETHGLLKRTAEHIIQIGQNLLSIKASLGHGHFEAWLQAEFTMSKRQAVNFMQTAERFGDKSAIIADLPVTVIYELAAPSTSEAIIEQVESKQISATLDAIKTAKEAERQVRAEQAALQEQLAREREAAAAQIYQLSLELECARQQLTQLSVSPTARIKEVPVVPSEVVAQLDALQRQVELLTTQREALAQRAVELEEQAQAMAAKREEEQYAREICLNWSNATAGIHTSLLKFLARFPTPQQVQVFAAPDWNRLTQTQAMLRRALDECERLCQESRGLVVDAAPGVSFAKEKEERYDRTANL